VTRRYRLKRSRCVLTAPGVSHHIAVPECAVDCNVYHENNCGPSLSIASQHCEPSRAPTIARVSTEPRGTAIASDALEGQALPTMTLASGARLDTCVAKPGRCLGGTITADASVGVASFSELLRKHAAPCAAARRRSGGTGPAGKTGPRPAPRTDRTTSAPRERRGGLDLVTHKAIPLSVRWRTDNPSGHSACDAVIDGRHCR
jgi:hypothetical protein